MFKIQKKILKMYEFNPNDKDHVSIKSWFKSWENYVQNKEFELAKALFITRLLVSVLGWILFKV